MRDHKLCNKLVIEEIKNEQISKLSTLVPSVERPTKVATAPEKEAPIHRHGGRVVRQLIRYKHEVHVLVSNTDKDNPSAYNEAMDDPESEKWNNVLDQEIDSMRTNKV
uniref:Uncharacterized protein n=1 Tax=Cannabis sativa TaxID=3483 RepID=A0A803QH20_CANSA